MKKYLSDIKEVSKLIEENRVLLLAGEEQVLDQLPAGNWIAGTIPYFMDSQGCLLDENKVHVTDITDVVVDFQIKEYDENNIKNIVEDEFENGFTVLIIPALQEIWQDFSINAPDFPNLFNNPLVGWVSGVEFSKVGIQTPKVYLSNNKYEKNAVAIHTKISKNKVARTEIINLYEQGNGDVIKFPEKGFNSNICFVNGQKQSLYNYMVDNKIKESLPLVANYSGANINISIILDHENKKANLFAPVFSDVEYKFAKSTEVNYISEFNKTLETIDTENIVFNCNCLMNYFNFELAGVKLKNISGPITFGEIAYQLVNSTFIYLVIE